MESDATTGYGGPETKRYCKVVLAGEEGVGKTSIFIRLRDKIFHEGKPSTIGCDHCDIERQLPNGDVVQVQLWDTAGAEQYGTLTYSYYRYAKAVIFIYSVDSRKSIDRLKFYIDDAQAHESKALHVFVCNKIDLPHDKHDIEDSDIERFLNERKTDAKGGDAPIHYRISAKENTGLDEALGDIIGKIASRLDQTTESNSFQIKPGVPSSGSSCSC